MGGQTCDIVLWVSFLLFPHLLVVVGGCGWVEHEHQKFVNGFGTLLGPEETPAVGGVFLVRPFPAWTV
jgi:hypothetical protein